MFNDRNLEYAQLVAENARLRAQNEELHSELKRLNEMLSKAIARIEELEEQLGLNSKNSSKPPSTDRKKKHSPKEPKKRRKRSGAYNRARIPEDQVSHHVSCKLDCCPHCGSDNLIERGKPAIHQQSEIPEPRIEVTQYTIHRYRCRGCHRKCSADLPNGVTYSAFGSRVLATIGLLTGAYHLSKREVVRLLRELFGLKIAVGSVSNFEAQISEMLKEPYSNVAAHARASPNTKYVDETSWLDRGQVCWVWLIATDEVACYRLTEHRDRKACQGLLGEEFDKPVVTDRYKVYEYLKIPHQFCLAHLRREAKRFAERPGLTGEIGLGLYNEITRTLLVHKEYREGEIAWGIWRRRLKECQKYLQLWLIEGIVGKVLPKLTRFCQGLWRQFDWFWVFMDIPGMEPTNNQAERDLRPLVLWRKRSFGTQSDRGQRYVERMMTIVMTARKLASDIANYLLKTIRAQRSGYSTPFLVPTH